jgi:exopolyphosphatase/guanosine-5'-triphosphate,3'-diphosphate pyrophosphatase
MHRSNSSVTRPVVPDTRAAMRLAAIDVGSNSLHMAIAQADADGGITTLWRMKEMVGLGRMSFPSKRLSVPAMDAAIATLARFQQAATRRDCEKILAIATSAVREAENGGDFLERVRAETGMTVRVVSAREEARLIYLGVRHAVDLKTFPNLFIDIGGGSVEFIVADSSKPLLLESRKLGAARMTARYVTSDPISEHDLTSLLHHFDREIGPIADHVEQLHPRSVIGSSGTIENLAAMCAALYGDGSETAADSIERDQLEKLTERLIESRSKDRARLRGLDDQRKDQVVAGALLARQVMRRLNIQRIKVSRSALREGILLDYLSRHLPDLAIRKSVPDPRRRSVLDLARRCDWHQTHSEHVTRLALSLFDQLKSLHGLSVVERELIEFGAMLHDIGWHVSKDKHHKHSMYLIQNGGLKGFTEEEVQIIANIARYHRKGAPKSEHDAFASLSSYGKRVVRVGAGLLRIADGLDRSHASAVTDVKVRNRKNKVDILAKAKSDIELELWGAKRKMDLLADTLDVDLNVKRDDGSA